MHIFIDESGIFANPEKKPHSISCVGALIIPDCSIEIVEEKFSRLLKEWGATTEIKASSLDEHQTDDVFRMLHRYNAVFEASILDLGVVEDKHIQLHREEQVRNLQKMADRSVHQEFKDEIQVLQTRLQKLSDPLYNQMIMMTVTVGQVIEMATMYFAQRRPRELANFQWVIDAKDKSLTEYEKLWMEMVLPFIQAETFRKPHGMMEGADYRHFERFAYASIPESFKGVISGNDPRPTNTRLLLGENRRFADSKSEAGLQLSDIATTTLRRALVGNFQHSGFKSLGSLIIRRKGGSLRLSYPTDEKHGASQSKALIPYFRILRTLQKENKSMLTRDFLREKRPINPLDATR